MARQKELADWADQVPANVQEAADKYIDTLRRKAAATEKFNAAKHELIDAMKGAKCGRVRVNYKDGTKVLELEELDHLILRKPETPPTSEDGDDE
jgi:hypothetical protein